MSAAPVVNAIKISLATHRAECGGALGFCQAGRYAVQAHGFVDRPSKDVDLFTTMAAISDFATAQAAVADALRAAGTLSWILAHLASNQS